MQRIGSPLSITSWMSGLPSAGYLPVVQIEPCYSETSLNFYRITWHYVEQAKCSQGSKHFMP
jgi:hypothetical protein